MMKVLHLFPDNEPLIAKHVKLLGNGQNDAVPDIVHVHGCWNYQTVRQALQAHRQGSRIVFTPHGGLEPWIISERRLSEKLCKTLLWQRRMAERSYVIIAQGNMEAEALRQLGWNPRIEIIRNAVITNSITPEEMARQTQAVYCKVMDSNTVELMSDAARQLLAMLLKAGITGDKRWVTATQSPDIGEEDWRRLLIYANHENVRSIVDAGSRVLGLHNDFTEAGDIESYLPTGYRKPRVEAHDVAGIVAEMRKSPLTLRHFVELDRALRYTDVADDWLCDALDENYQLKFFRRLLQVLTEQTGLDEGFWPAEPLNDRRTRTIRNLLNNHLRI